MAPTNEPAANPPTPGLSTQDAEAAYDAWVEGFPHRCGMFSVWLAAWKEVERRLADARPVPPAEVLEWARLVDEYECRTSAGKIAEWVLSLGRTGPEVGT